MSATHPRTCIRQEVVARLKASKVVDGETLYATPAGSRVFPGRTLPMNVKKMPALLVYDDKEEVKGEYYQDRPKRVVTLTVEAQATADSAEDLDLLLDALALVVERIILADPRQGKNAQDTSYSETLKLRDAEGDRHFGWLWLDFLIDYAMPLEDQTSGLADFLLFHADYDLAPQDGAIEASDDIRMRPEEP
ncbi:MAG: hypothetical protein C0405_10005 [Desulfovibrio sp.]|nr:hypothetical protein [Desulfovibrio sp.]